MEIKIIPIKDYPDKIRDFKEVYYKHENGDIITFAREDICVMWQDKFLGFINFNTCPFTTMWLKDAGINWWVE